MPVGPMSVSKSSPPAWNSTIGLKLLMALTGLGMVGFVLVHMSGHLKMFEGRDAYNDYAAFLQGLGGLKWVARLGLLAILGVHVACAVKLSARNASARPSRYEGLKHQASTPWGRSMLLTGFVILAFLAFHLSHFTAELVFYDSSLMDPDGHRDVYTNFVLSFQNPLITLTYLLSVLAVSLHLSHAVSSMFRTLGLARGRFDGPLMKVGPGLAIATGLGFAVVPLACLLGLISA